MIVGCVCADRAPITAAIRKHLANLADLLVIRKASFLSALRNTMRVDGAGTKDSMPPPAGGDAVDLTFARFITMALAVHGSWIVLTNAAVTWD